MAQNKEDNVFVSKFWTAVVSKYKIALSRTTFLRPCLLLQRLFQLGRVIIRSYAVLIFFQCECNIASSKETYVL